jgi:Metalloenzyme superfamily
VAAQLGLEVRNLSAASRGMAPVTICSRRAGLGMSLGMEWLPAAGATGSYDSLFHRKAAAVADAVTTGGFQFGFVHVKAVDDCGHDRLWQLKVRYLEVVDQMLGQIVRRLHEAEQARALPPLPRACSLRWVFGAYWVANTMTCTRAEGTGYVPPCKQCMPDCSSCRRTPASRSPSP